MRGRIRRTDGGDGIEALRRCAIVKVELHMIGKGRGVDSVDEGCARRRARSIVQAEICPATRELLCHRKDGRDADTAGEEQRALRRAQWKQVARRADADLAALVDVVVRAGRATATRRVAQDADLVAASVRAVAAQRI